MEFACSAFVTLRIRHDVRKNFTPLWKRNYTSNAYPKSDLQLSNLLLCLCLALVFGWIGKKISKCHKIHFQIHTNFI